MEKTMKIISVVSILALICFSLAYLFTDVNFFLTLAITFGTVAYHFCIRLIVGSFFNIIMKNKADYTKKWYRVSDSEQKLYKALKVKKWKSRLPTYDKDIFDASKHSWDEIAQAMCQSELVHEVNILFSFVPVIASVWFGEFAVFLITSVLGAAFDLMFVFMQRYNRPRVIKLINRKQMY